MRFHNFSVFNLIFLYHFLEMNSIFLSVPDPSIVLASEGSCLYVPTQYARIQGTIWKENDGLKSVWTSCWPDLLFYNGPTFSSSLSSLLRPSEGFYSHASSSFFSNNFLHFPSLIKEERKRKMEIVKRKDLCSHEEAFYFLSHFQSSYHLFSLLRTYNYKRRDEGPQWKEDDLRLNRVFIILSLIEPL